jgi:transcriptional regulator with XRE-family HTH domain
MHPWPPIGENIARLRSLSGLTQEELAARAEVSADLIRRLEQGNRQTALIGSLYKIANGLDVPLSVLLSQQPVFSGQESDDALSEVGRIDGLRRLLQPAASGPGQDPVPLALPDLRQASRESWRLFQVGQLGDLAALLPGVIPSALQLANDLQGHARDRALVEASQLWNVGSAVLTTLGYEDLGYEAARQALDLAHHADDALVPLWATAAMEYVLGRQGRLGEAEGLAVRTAEANEPSFGSADAAHISAWGHVVRLGMMAAVRQERHSQAGNLLNLMQMAALRLGRDYVDDYHVWYGPTSVGMHAVSRAVESGDFDEALTLAPGVPTEGGTATRTRMHYLLDIANAQAHGSRPDEAVGTLLMVRRQTPEWMRYQVLARETVRMLLGMRGISRSGSDSLRKLATFVNVEA